MQKSSIEDDTCQENVPQIIKNEPSSSLVAQPENIGQQEEIVMGSTLKQAEQVPNELNQNSQKQAQSEDSDEKYEEMIMIRSKKPEPEKDNKVGCEKVLEVLNEEDS